MHYNCTICMCLPLTGYKLPGCSAFRQITEIRLPWIPKSAEPVDLNDRETRRRGKTRFRFCERCWNAQPMQTWQQPSGASSASPSAGWDLPWAPKFHKLTMMATFGALPLHGTIPLVFKEALPNADCSERIIICGWEHRTSLLHKVIWKLSRQWVAYCVQC